MDPGSAQGRIDTPLLSLQLFQLHWVFSVQPNHEVASSSSFKGGRDDDVAASRKLKPCKNLPVIDVRTRGATIVRVHEVARSQSFCIFFSSVQTKPNLKHLHLSVSLASPV